MSSTWKGRDGSWPGPHNDRNSRRDPFYEKRSEESSLQTVFRFREFPMPVWGFSPGGQEMIPPALGDDPH